MVGRRIGRRVLAREPDGQGRLALVSRILVLFVFLLWMTGASDPGLRPPDGFWPSDWSPALHPAGVVGVFAGVYALLILFMRLWSRLVARRIGAPDYARRLRRFN